MRGHSDDWVESRILWSLGKRGLPREETYLYSDPKAPIPVKLRSLAHEGIVGRPVVAFIHNDNQWTLLGTSSVISKYPDAFVNVPLDSLQDLSLVGSTEIPKNTCEWIQLFDYNDQIYMIWGPPGEECLALSGLLLMLIRMQKSNT